MYDKPDTNTRTSLQRSRWAAIGAALAVTLGAGGIGIVNATESSGPRPTYTSINPCRLADTRPGTQVGVRSGVLSARAHQTHNATNNAQNGNCPALPTDITAIVTNTTVIQPTASTFVSLNPGTTPTTTSSNLNARAGDGPTPNAVTTGLDSNGRFTIYNHAGNIHYAIDIVGYYRPHDHDDRYLQSKNEGLAYAWNNVAAGALNSPVNVSTNYSYNPSGLPIRVTRTATGRYSVVFPGLNMSGGHVQVTAYGSNSDRCKVESWGPSSVSVRCFNGAGAPVNTRFTVLALD